MHGRLSNRGRSTTEEIGADPVILALRLRKVASTGIEPESRHGAEVRSVDLVRVRTVGRAKGSRPGERQQGSAWSTTCTPGEQVNSPEKEGRSTGAVISVHDLNPG